MVSDSMTVAISIAAILESAVFREGRLAVDIPEGWMQGRTAYGGLSTTLALAGARRAVVELPPLRSAQITFLGPLAGRVEVTAKLARRGRNSAFVQAEIYSDQGLGLSAMFLFGQTRPSVIDFQDMPMPEALAPEDVAPPVRKSQQKIFTEHLDYRSARPKGGPRLPDMLRWARLNEREGLDSVTELLAVGDAQPPAAVSLMTELKPASSINWTINLLTSEPLTRNGWWLLRSSAVLVRDGFSSQSMTVWNRDGTPIAHGLQSVAIFA
jgi:acyl-CoA thioesterase